MYISILNGLTGIYEKDQWTWKCLVIKTYIIINPQKSIKMQRGAKQKTESQISINPTKYICRTWIFSKEILRPKVLSCSCVKNTYFRIKRLENLFPDPTKINDRKILIETLDQVCCRAASGEVATPGGQALNDSWDKWGSITQSEKITPRNSKNCCNKYLQSQGRATPPAACD